MENAAPAAAAPAPAAQSNAPATPAKAETPAEAKYRLKVAGEEREYTRAEVEKFAGKGAFADQTLKAAKDRIAAVAKREAELAELEKVWDDDERLEAELAKRGKLDKLARKRLEAKVAEGQKTPEQLKAEAAERERDEAIAKLKQRDEEAKAAKQAEVNKHIAAQMESQLLAAAEKAGLKEPGAAMAADDFYALWEVVKDWRAHKLPWDAERIVEFAQENIDKGFQRLEQSVLKSLKGRKLVDRLGPAVVKEILRYKAEELRNGGRPAPSAPANERPAVAPTKAEHESPQDFLARQRGLTK